jgi:prophage regulatory protein
MNQLSGAGFLRLHQIIGQKAVTDSQARKNLELNRLAESNAIAMGKLDRNGRPKFKRLPTKPKAEITPIVPVSRSNWLAGVLSGRYPKPIKLGPGVTVWSVEDIRDFLDQYKDQKNGRK